MLKIRPTGDINNSVSSFMPRAQVELKLIQDTVAIILSGLGLLLILALVSYDRSDIGFFTSPANDPKVNFIGPVGAYVAAGLFLSIGLAAYLVPFIMILAGIALVLGAQIDYRFKAIWLAIMIISGAALIQFAEPLLGGMIEDVPPGGALGWLITDRLLSQALGTVGAAILLSTIYASSLILLFEIKPIKVAISIWELSFAWYKERERIRIESADPIERIEIERKKLAKQEKKLRKKLEKEGLKALKPHDISEEEDAYTESKLRKKDPQKSISASKSLDNKKSESTRTESTSSTIDPIPEVTLKTYDDYKVPSLDILTPKQRDQNAGKDSDEMTNNLDILVHTLKQFGIEVEPGNITKGATITRYEVYPAPGIRVERISSLSKNLSRALKAERINILAPIPGKDTVGIEVGNSKKLMIVLRELFESELWKTTRAKLPIALGKDVYGQVIVADLADMPHLLIAGSTGSGKSVCVNTILMSLVYRFSPEDLRLILVDPKVVELQVYNRLPHLVVPVVTEPKKVLVALRWVINEMEKRYRTMAQAGVRNVSAYNKLAKRRKKESETEISASSNSADNLASSEEGGELLSMTDISANTEEQPEHMPYIVVIIDELADLMQTSSADVELAIARLSAKARAAGIHLIIATQTPRASVITGVIKTNVPCRIAFQVPSALDSRVILDENGAENLLGKGDMLYLPPGSSKVVRAQGAFVSEEEVKDVVEFVGNDSEQIFNEEIHEKLRKDVPEQEERSPQDEALIERCLEVIRQEKRASTSLLQRRLRIGYNKASWVMDQLEIQGVVGPREGARDREILMDLDT
ncbi:MAG: DNA translocase FtsK [Verrucomicrobiota bacterium]